MSRYFQKGVPNTGNGGGRPSGSRDRLTRKFLYDLAEDYEQHGAGVIKICRIEDPIQYLRIVASILPKELQIETGALGELSDEQIAGYISMLQQMRVAKVPAEDSELEETKH